MERPRFWLDSLVQLKRDSRPLQLLERSIGPAYPAFQKEQMLSQHFAFPHGVDPFPSQCIGLLVNGVENKSRSKALILLPSGLDRKSSELPSGKLPIAFNAMSN
jgi:hypothetical protein